MAKVAMGLGGLSTVSLVVPHTDARDQSIVGVDPIANRNAIAPVVPTFGEAADQFVEDMSPQFRNAKHIAQWTMTLTEYAKPLRSIPVNEITTDDVWGVLKPIWQTKSETASRLRGRYRTRAGRSKGTRPPFR